MILDQTITLNQYKLFVQKKIKSYEYSCPQCGDYGNFYRHGTYVRNVISYQSGICEEQIPILRLKCTSCCRTHAILPKGVIPYHIYMHSIYIKMFSIAILESVEQNNLKREIGLSYSIRYQFFLWFYKSIGMFISFAVSYQRWLWRINNHMFQQKWNRHRILGYISKVLWFFFFHSIRRNTSIYYRYCQTVICRNPHNIYNAQ